MSVLGLNDLKQFALPTGWDGGELAKYSLADGVNWDAMTNDIAAALMAQASAMLNDPVYGGLVTVTTELGKEYRDGDASTGMQRRTEYANADARRASTIGHMYPMIGFDRVLGWTFDFLRKARSAQIDANISAALYDVRDNFERETLRRFFAIEEYTLGTSGKDVPFVKGTGVSYTPPAHAGKTFASTHTHFDRQTDNAAGRLAAAKNGVNHLHEHGIIGPYVGIIPDADKADWAQVTGFYKPRRTELNYPDTVGTASVNEDVFVGIVEVELGLIYLHASPRLATDYFGLYKTYGLNDLRNPLAVRVEPDYLFTPILIRDQLYQHPMQGMKIIHDFGVGVNDRLNGYACEFDSSGDYATPTIS